MRAAELGSAAQDAGEVGAAPLGYRVEPWGRCPPMAASLAAHGQIDGDRPSAAQLDHEARLAIVEVLGRGGEAQARSADDAVEARVAQDDATPADERLQAPAVVAAPHAANLEQICEIGLEPNRQGEAQRSAHEAAQDEPLAVLPFRQDLGARQVHGAVRQAPGAAAEVRIGQVEGEPRIVAPRRRAQQKGALAGKPEDQAGEMPGPAMVDTLLAEPLRPDVPVAVEDSERLAMLENLVVGVCQL